jgi:hypothetical protein
VISAGAISFALLRAWPLWAVGLVAMLPWVPLLALDMAWTVRRYQWLALFYLLAVTQLGHLGEHVAQMVQMHMLALSGPNARGIVGTLDIEWVHFVWNTWVLIAVLLLVRHFRTSAWLWLTAALAAWHGAEHLYIMSLYLPSGLAGAPGLLAQGGALGGGLPITRPDLHFFYNLVETTPLVLAFIGQVRHIRLQPPLPIHSGRVTVS